MKREPFLPAMIPSRKERKNEPTSKPIESQAKPQIATALF
jgi:hypothetical protein